MAFKHEKKTSDTIWHSSLKKKNGYIMTVKI